MRMRTHKKVLFAIGILLVMFLYASCNMIVIDNNAKVTRITHNGNYYCIYKYTDNTGFSTEIRDSCNKHKIGDRINH